MPQKRTPIRTCVGCGTERAKRELVRIVRTPEGTVVADATGKRSQQGGHPTGRPWGEGSESSGEIDGSGTVECLLRLTRELPDGRIEGS